MASKKYAFAAGAAAAVFAASGAGAFPAYAAANSVGSVFSGTVEIASTNGILIARRQRKGDLELIAVDTDLRTVVSRGGQALSIEDLAQGSEVVVSGTKTEEGTVLASKILIRR